MNYRETLRVRELYNKMLENEISALEAQMPEVETAQKQIIEIQDSMNKITSDSIENLKTYYAQILEFKNALIHSHNEVSFAEWMFEKTAEKLETTFDNARIGLQELIDYALHKITQRLKTLVQKPYKCGYDFRKGNENTINLLLGSKR